MQFNRQLTARNSPYLRFLLQLTICLFLLCEVAANNQKTVVKDHRTAGHCLLQQAIRDKSFTKSLFIDPDHHPERRHLGLKAAHHRVKVNSSRIPFAKSNHNSNSTTDTILLHLNVSNVQDTTFTALVNITDLENAIGEDAEWLNVTAHNVEARLEKSKLALLLLEISLLGVVGMDRIYMEQYKLGLLKSMVAVVGFTMCCASWRGSHSFLTSLLDHCATPLIVGFLWCTFDYVMVMNACLSKSDHIEGFGFHAHFIESKPGHYAAFFLAATHICILAFGCGFNIVTVARRGSPIRTRGRNSGPKEGCSMDEALSNSNMALCESTLPEPCPVCLEPIIDGEKMQTLPCFHILHHKCALMHFGKSKLHVTCPMCRCVVAGPPLPDPT